MDKLVAVIGGILLFVVVALCIVLLTAFTVSTLWGWFVVPLGVANIGFAQAYGISLLTSVLLSTRGLDMEGSNKGWKTTAAAIVINLLALLFGFITVGFM